MGAISQRCSDCSLRILHSTDYSSYVRHNRSFRGGIRASVAFDRVREVVRVLQDLDGAWEFDEELFGMLVEQIRVINLVQGEFMLRSGVGVVEIL